jgi:hypothetical protein
VTVLELELELDPVFELPELEPADPVPVDPDIVPSITHIVPVILYPR